jgi:hypothetical protein
MGRRDVLKNLVVGCGGCKNLLYLVVAKRQRRTATDDGGEQDVSVGDESHGASFATPQIHAAHTPALRSVRARYARQARPVKDAYDVKSIIVQATKPIPIPRKTPLTDFAVQSSGSPAWFQWVGNRAGMSSQ